MHRSVYEAIIRSRARIEKLLGERERPDYDPPWERLEVDGDIDELVAVDGSLNQSPRTSYLVFALSGLSLLFSKDAPRDSALSHVDILERGVFRRRYLENVLGTWMRLAEIRSVLKMNPSRGTLVLIDGSFISDIINPKPTHEWINASFSEEEREELNCIEDEIAGMGLYDDLRGRFNAEDFVAFNLVNEQLNDWPRERKYLALAILLHREHLVALEHLVRSGWKLLFISKDSISHDYVDAYDFKGIYSDQVLFSLFTRGRGFAPPMRVDVKSKKYSLGKRRMDLCKEKGDLQDDFKDEFKDLLTVEMYQTFVRFSYHSLLVYKVEGVGMGDEEMVKLLEKVASLSPEGYPLPLEKAHREVLITYNDIELVSQALLPTSSNLREALR
ncbi:MAG: DNA double-strand break repair nuclease NurA [Thermotogae bacterium]|nr:DNA double-strand break repair nuclease NurA [Thermotogota bacterium]